MRKSPVVRFASQVFWFFCSLKLAIVIMLGLTASMIVATTLESLYDTATAKFWVYQSWYFYFLLAMLGIQIFLVALSRYPWKKRHIPFLMAHAGIIILLLGSWITDRHGLDGILRLDEGQQGTVVEVDSPTLVVHDSDQVRAIPVRWVPPNAEFRPMKIQEYGLEIRRMLSHADPQISFVPAPAEQAEQETAGSPHRAAIQLKLQGGPMRASQDFWLWAGDPAWSMTQAGPARLFFFESKEAREALKKPFDETRASKSPWLALTLQPGGSLSYEAVGSDGKRATGVLPAGKIQGQVIQPGWKGGVTLTVTQWVPRATSQTSYTPSRIQYGPQAPPSAIYISAGKGGPESEIWLGMGDRATLQYQGRTIGIGYYPKRYLLPFAIRLDRFQIDHYEGTMNPMSFSSRVTVMEGEREAHQALISMNEPLEHRGITFYQASYEEAQPRPTVSIFSVNQDPGRWWKYIGSLLIVLGTILLFASKYSKKKSTARTAVAKTLEVDSA